MASLPLTLDEWLATHLVRRNADSAHRQELPPLPTDLCKQAAAGMPAVPIYS